MLHALLDPALYIAAITGLITGNAALLWQLRSARRTAGRLRRDAKERFQSLAQNVSDERIRLPVTLYPA
jgi:hypothetical protein